MRAARGAALLSCVASAAALPAQCPPRSWIYSILNNGHWIVDHTDPSWGWYLDFLGVPADLWPIEYNATDVHEYIFFDEGENTSFIMNHTIPASVAGSEAFHLQFQASVDDIWQPNPYPRPTPGGLDPGAMKVNFSTFRNAFDDGPGEPYPRDTACLPWRTDMPVVSNFTGKPTEYIVVFWRLITSPVDMHVVLKVTDPQGNIIEPWKSKGFSLRYFKKARQSYSDAVNRYKCTPSPVNPARDFCS